MDRNIKVIFFDMGNTLLHFHFGKTDEEKDAIGLEYLTNYLKKFNPQINYNEVENEFFKKWDKVMPLRKVYHTEYAVEGYLNDFLSKYGIRLDIENCIEAMEMFYTEYRNNVWTENNIYETLSEIKKKGNETALKNL